LLLYYNRPILKILDNLLVMGLLTDDDMHQLLFLIDPETFDEGICRGNVWLLLVCLFLFRF